MYIYRYYYIIVVTLYKRVDTFEKREFTPMYICERDSSEYVLICNVRI